MKQLQCIVRPNGTHLADVAALREIRAFVAAVNDDCEEDEERDHVLDLIDGMLALHPIPIPEHLKPAPLASAIARGLSHEELKKEFYGQPNAKSHP